MRRRVALLLAAMGAALVLATGVALAASIQCPNAANGVCNGTNAPDTLAGTNSVDTINGFGGDDAMYGYGANDTMNGGNESGYGDGIYGGLGNDRIYGQGGNDLIEGDYGNDYLDTGPGSDRVNAQDGYADTIVCGSSTADLVYHDSIDTLTGCSATTALSEEEAPGGPPEGLLTTHGKILVEHEGQNLCLPQSMVTVHLEHGDDIVGVCEVEQLPGPDEPQQGLGYPLTVDAFGNSVGISDAGITVVSSWGAQVQVPFLSDSLVN